MLFAKLSYDLDDEAGTLECFVQGQPRVTGTVSLFGISEFEIPVQLDASPHWGTQFICFTGKKVHVLTQQVGGRCCGKRCCIQNRMRVL